MSLRSVLTSIEPALKPAKPRTAKPLPLTAHADLHVLWTWGRADEVLGHAALETAAAESDAWWFSQVWLTPAQAKAAQKQLQKVPGFPSTLVPIATDEAGNYTCHDTGSGKLVDWDHETRKTRRLPGTLATIFTRVGKLLVAEQKRAATAKATTKVVPLASASVALPAKIRLATSPIVRKLAAHHKAQGFADAVLSTDGTRFGALVHAQRKACFGDLAHDIELVPAEPAIVAFHKERGYVSLDSSGLASDGDMLAWRDSSTGQLTLWAWREGAPALVAGGKWTKGTPYFHQHELRLRGGWLACTAAVAGKGALALWPVDAFPKLSAASAIKELAPVKKIALSSPVALFDLHSDGTAITLVNEALVRWDARTGKQLASTTLEDTSGLAASPIDSRTVVLASSGELQVLDGALAVVHRMQTTTGRRRGSTVRFAPSGAWFATSAHGWDKDPSEVVLWSATTYKEIARIAIKSGANGFGLRGVSSSALMTVSPLALLTLA